MSSKSASTASTPRPLKQRLAEYGLLLGVIVAAGLTAGATLGEKPSDIHHRIERQAASRL